MRLKLRPLVFLTTVTTILVACEAPKSGQYFGGMVVVDLNDNDSARASSRQKSNQRTEATRAGTDRWTFLYNEAARRRNNPNDRSAAAVAVGDCWSGCESNDPSPMNGFEIAFEVDVDVAYTRIKRDFGFETMLERSGGSKVFEARLNKSLDFRYSAVPGVEYKMRGYVQHAFKTEEPLNTIQVQLFVDGKDKSIARVMYYSGNIKDLGAYKISLEKRIFAVVEGVL